MSAQPALTLQRVETWLSQHGITAGPEEDGAVFMGFPGCDIGVYLHDEEDAPRRGRHVVWPPGSRAPR